MSTWATLGWTVKFWLVLSNRCAMLSRSSASIWQRIRVSQTIWRNTIASVSACSQRYPRGASISLTKICFRQRHSRSRRWPKSSEPSLNTDKLSIAIWNLKIRSSTSEIRGSSRYCREMMSLYGPMAGISHLSATLGIRWTCQVAGNG